MAPGRSCLGTIEVEEEDDDREHCCAAAIVKAPCCCCWLSLVLAIVASGAGGAMIMQANSGRLAGPIRGTSGANDGLTYPITTTIAKQMDALYLSNRDSQAVYRQYTSTDSSRRLNEAQEEAHVAEEAPSALSALNELVHFVPESAGGATVRDLFRLAWPHGINKHTIAEPRPATGAITGAPRTVVGHKPDDDLDTSVHRALQSSDTVAPQTDNLVVALFVFNARSSSGSVFTDKALAEMCSLHQSLTTDNTVSGPRQGYADFCQKSNGNCTSGTSPLVFFYGPATYDIDTLDVSIASSPNFETIVSGFSAAQNTFSPNMTNQQYLFMTYPGEAPQAFLLRNKLFGYMTNWFTSPITTAPFTGCDPSMKKNTDAVMNVMVTIRESPALSRIFGPAINHYFDRGLSRANPHSRYTQAVYTYGAPQPNEFPPYTSGNDRRQQQQDNFVQWFMRDANLPQYYNENDRSLWPTVRPTPLISVLALQMLLDLLLFDALRAVLPLVLVFLIVWFQTRSIFIALVTLVECTLSFTAAIMVLTAIGIKWMAMECFLAIYIVLAIGADDVFVFMDAYKASFYKGPAVNASLTKRMSWVYRRAGLAMFITSLTTASAFVATAVTSPIPTLQVVGIFAAAVIIIDYVLVMTFLCASVVVYHNWFERKPALCCVCCTCAPPGSACDWWLCHASKHGGCEQFCNCCGEKMKTSTEVAQGGGPETFETAKPLYVRLFEDIFPFNLVVRNPITRAVSIVVFLALLIPFTIQATRIEAQTSAENFLPEDHPFQRFITASSEFLGSNDDTMAEEQIVYGFNPSDPVDITGVNRLMNPDNWGTPKHSASFVLDEAAQMALIEDCAQLRAAPPTVVQRRFDQDTQQTNEMVFCWIEAFRAYRSCCGLPFPVNGSASEAVLAWSSVGESSYPSSSSCPAYYARTCSSEASPRGHRIPGAGYTQTDYEADLGWASDGASGLRLIWTRVRADSTLKQRAYLPAVTLRRMYDEWETLIAQLNADTPTSLGSAMHVSSTSVDPSSNKWLHMILQETYVRMAFTGVATGLAIAFVVLLIATMNFIVTLLSILTIMAALACVVGVVVLRGWELGSAESLSMMILTGFAVDYVVHLSHAYMESDKSSRLERVHDALRDLGISVFWGMLTSIISAGVLASLQLQFFAKFGLFFFLTIIWSYLWSVLFLMPLLAFIGPVGVGKHAVQSHGVGHEGGIMYAEKL